MPSASEPKRPCPVCGQPMRKETVHTIQVDTCKEHGLWLDKGNWRASAPWSGGMKKRPKIKN